MRLVRSKAALDMLLRRIALKLAPHRIRVRLVPGRIPRGRVSTPRSVVESFLVGATNACNMLTKSEPRHVAPWPLAVRSPVGNSSHCFSLAFRGDE